MTSFPVSEKVWLPSPGMLGTTGVAVCKGRLLFVDRAVPDVRISNEVSGESGTKILGQREGPNVQDKYASKNKNTSFDRAGRHERLRGVGEVYTTG